MPSPFPHSRCLYRRPVFSIVGDGQPGDGAKSVRTAWRSISDLSTTLLIGLASGAIGTVVFTKGIFSIAIAVAFYWLIDLV